MLKVIATLMVALGFLPMAISTGVGAELHRPPRILKHQGRLLDATDKPVNGTHDLTVRLYNVPSGGSPLSTSTSSVVFEDGLFMIGLSDDAINMMFASIAGGDNRYLGFEVDSDGEMSPRQLITSAPYSILSSGVGASQPIPGSFDTAKIDFQTTSTGASLRISTKEPTKLEIPNLRMTGDVTGANFSMTGDPDFDLLRLSAGADSAKIRISGQSIGDPDFDLLRISGGGGSGGSAGGEIAMGGDPDFDLLRMSAGPDTAKIRISGQSIGDPDFDLLRIVAGKGIGDGDVSMALTGDPDFDLLRLSANADSAVISMSGQVIGDPDFDLLRMIGRPQYGNKTMQVKNSAGTIRGITTEVDSATASYHYFKWSSGSVKRNMISMISDDETGTMSISNGDGTRGLITRVNNSGGSIAIDEEGVQKIRLDTDSTHAGIAVNEEGIQIAISVDSGGLANIGINETLPYTNKVSFNSDGDGYLSNSLKIGTTVGTNHIEVVGGANCNGSTWNNASDAASKENFQQIDGEQILEKLESLEITRWNYIGKDDAEHIGPTAQDFYKAFGVGGDDKTISTVDPSGIALAAIKELYKKSKEVDELKKQLDELTKAVAKLSKELK